MHINSVRTAILQPGPSGLMDEGDAAPTSPLCASAFERSLSYELKNTGEYYKLHNIVKLLVPITICGWLLFGAICILCINGRGRAGRWIPEWYLDSKGTRWNKAAVGAWWLAVMFAWPIILPCTAVSRMSRSIKEWRAQRRNREADQAGTLTRQNGQV